MIFVTVGMSSYKFDRLLIAMDKIATEINEEVIMQTGCSDFVPENTTFYNYLSRKEMDRLYEKARVIISHGGVGSVIAGIIQKKPLLVVPRLKQYNEHYDNHQVEFVSKIKEEKKAIIIDNPKEILSYLLKKELWDLDLELEQDNTLIFNLKEYIKSLRN
ncbi:glycosyltransferase [Methanobacterium oryzae]|uniref:glycosyltransferase n=1 Tax=Methanobacterium oryzae TaxID=69540 RepID=UPI003D209FEB